MLMILLNVLTASVGGAVVAAAIAWLSWTVLRWTGYPGIGPMIAFAILAFTLNSSDFGQMLLVFSALFAIGGLVTLVGPSRPVKPREKAASPTVGAGPRL